MDIKRECITEIVKEFPWVININYRYVTIIDQLQMNHEIHIEKIVILNDISTGQNIVLCPIDKQIMLADINLLLEIKEKLISILDSKVAHAEKTLPRIIIVCTDYHEPVRKTLSYHDMGILNFELAYSRVVG